MTLTHERARLAALTRADISAHVRAGHFNRDIIRHLAVAPQAITAVRAQVGMPSDKARGFRPHSVDEAFWGLARHIPGGHLLWVGPVSPEGTAYFRQGDNLYAACRVAYGFSHDTAPTGHVTAGCDEPRCVDPGHVIDQPERTYLSAVFTVLFGAAQS
ncbi:hypothetical protein OOK29_25850 [Streptomyces phaeochromogenes]|uniref:hypothetical protein n=1 Tax=Streptomyces phaeochromogenes TaxID=1923 RepID=UPI002253DB0D|nr:hypothetical protein [Streptomyces phaeochromogenes]MCX5601578.1 hypothetical protein [Streptomyces phaeochromogenes]